MSTKTKNISGRTVTQRVQTKRKDTTSDKKADTVRNAKEKIDEKKSKTDTTKLTPKSSKEDKEKTKWTASPRQITKDPKQSTRKPLVAKSKNGSGRTPVPQSKRIVKTQFFPSKNHYAEMLQQLNRYQWGSGDGIKNEKPKLNRESSSESISTSERPRTSTLRKGSIVNENIAGPEVPKNQSPTEEKYDEEAEYEDDFDSYESDFENVSSSDSTVHNLSEISTESTSSEEEPSSKATPSASKDTERKLDSGNFDLKEDKIKREFSNLQDLIEMENLKLKRPESNIRSNLTSLSDEGFEEARSLQFLNFVTAKKRNDRRKSMEIRKKRGEELLNMIKLDCVNFTVLNLPPVPYEEFIKTYGNLNSMQIGIQTGEESHDEEIQTDAVETQEKWIQMPPNFTNNSTSCYKFERLGVGPPLDATSKEEEYLEPQFNQYKLEKFLSNTGGLILDILKERKPQPTLMNPESPFSEAVIKLRPPSEFSAKRRIVMVEFNHKNPSLFLSVHVEEEEGERCARSMVYLWNVNESLPEVYMMCHGELRSCCFGNDSETVFGGLQNGSVVVWETTKNVIQPQNICIMIEGDFSLRCPTFVTDIEKSHCCSVVAIECVSESNDFGIFDEVESTWKVCSLDQEGTIVIWSIIAKQRQDSAQNGGTAYWGRLILMKSFEISLRNMLPDLDDLSCNDMIVLSEYSLTVFVGTNYGNVLQCELNKEKSHVKIHTQDISSPVKCLVPCPFSSTYFLAGLENGSVLLYSRKSTKSLMVITNKDSKNMDDPIEEIQWSFEKPCIFYSRNSSNFIDVWDLSKSSVFPIESMRSEEEITCMKLSQSKMDKSFMITSTETTILLHFLNQDHKKENEDQHSKEMKTFLTYVNRL